MPLLTTQTSGDQPPAATTLVVELLQHGDPVRFSAFGPSMHPVIRSGESVLVHPVQTDDLRPGSILLFKYHGRLLLHRFIRQDRDGWGIAVADAALSGCDTIHADDVVGVAMSVRRRERDRRLNTHSTRCYGLLRYHARPLRRFAATLLLRAH